MPDLFARIILPLLLLLWVENTSGQEFAGSTACASCHQQAYEKWRGSHHQLAMQVANETTVLGDFNGGEFTYAGVSSRFHRKDGRYFVTTDGADGQLGDHEITHTFGVYPLQQYLIAFPDGRYQALGIAWDTRSTEQGGQRWLHVYQGQEIGHDNELHWTRPSQNWNFMCADCHSTNLQKNYRPADDSFATSSSEISVGCEACHGPASRHLEWAGMPASERAQHADRGLAFLLDERSEVHWQVAAGKTSAKRSQANTTRREIEVCASCHSRRGILREGAAREASFLDHYLPALLSDGLYHVDGQIRDEVYVWGSFVQSRMYAAGVTCSDCHDPHDQKLKTPGDGVCAQCHLPAKYAATEHHHHPADSSGARCANCHMPETTYMVVDPRRDHSMRIPRPDHSLRYGTPNACTQCHTDQEPEWAAQKFSGWYPEPRPVFQTWAETFRAARSGDPAAGGQLAALIGNPDIPDIARATALLELAPYLDPQTAPALQNALQDDSPLVRMAAMRVMDAFPVESVLPLSAHLLQDDLRAVRTEAARVLAGAPKARMNQAGRDLLQGAVREYITTQELNADRSENLMNLGNLYASMDEPGQAERYFRKSVQREPGFVPAWINLADLYRAQGLEGPAIETLKKGIAQAPGSAALQHALGLALVRQKNTPAALAALEKATALEPAEARFAYVYGVALNSAGQGQQALEVLAQAHNRHPRHREMLFALATISRDLGKAQQAIEWAGKLLALNPGDDAAQSLMDALAAPE